MTFSTKITKAICTAAAILAILLAAKAQVSLTTSPYTQSFNDLGAGLPAGWTVRTGATGTAAGTIAAFTPTATSWASISGNFRNVASAEGLDAAATSATQQASTNRALGLRQTTSFGDNNAAFTFQVANTAGKTHFSLRFLLQSLDNTSPRQAAWLVQYGIGANPAVFTTVATSPTAPATGANTFSSQQVTADFGNALNNRLEEVWIRIVTLTPTTGTGNRPTTAIDDVALSWAVPGDPFISTSLPSLAFGPQAMGTFSAVQSYTVTGENLGGPLALQTTGPFGLSRDGNTFATQLLLTPQEAAAGFVVQVRFEPTASGMLNGSIAHSSAGAVSRTVSLSGEGFNPSTTAFNFNGCTAGGPPGSSFTTFSAAGAQVWNCTTLGRNGTAAAQMNGFASGAQTNEDWLISPALNLAAFSVPVLSFYSLSTFSGPALEVFISTNYTGSGDPRTANWTKLAAKLPAAGSNQWTFTDSLVLLDYKAHTAFIAFRYLSDPVSGASRWTVDDVEIRNESGILLSGPAAIDFGEIASGTASAPAALQLRAAGYGNVQVTVPAPFQISTDGIAYTTSLLVPEATALTGTTLQVRVAPASRQFVIAGTVQATGTGLNATVAQLSASSFTRNETFEAVTWNLYFLGSNVPGTAPADALLQRQNMVEAINRMQPDLIAIQELSDEAALNTLMASLGNVYDYVVSPRWSYSFDPPDANFPPQKVGFIYKKTTVSLLSARVMFAQMYDAARIGQSTPLDIYPTGSPSSFYSSGRLPFMAGFSSTIAGVTKQFRAVVLHGKSGGSSLTDWQRRAFDARVLKDSLDVYYAADPVMVLGDFNDRLAGSINSGQVSSYKIFTDDAAGYRPLTMAAEQAGRISFLGSGGSMIDHIIVTDELSEEYLHPSAGPVDLRPFIPSFASTTSDHLPVEARFEWRNATVLPLRIVQFTGRRHENAVRLAWTIRQEGNAVRYVVERAADGARFAAIGRVEGNGAATYYWSDPAPGKGTRFYRLRVTESNGRAQYSPVIRVTDEALMVPEIVVYPNPVHKGTLQVKGLPEGVEVRAQLLSADGRVVAESKGQGAMAVRQLAESTLRIPAGMYLLRLHLPEKTVSLKLVLTP